MKDKDQGVFVAPGAGFCPGVKKAIDCVLELEAAGKKPVYTIGPLIHNKQATDSLEAKGIKAIDSLGEAADKNGVLVIRAHGITPEFQKEVESQGMEVLDATCPLVKKVHTVIAKYAEEGYTTVIVGDSGHAEVTGLLGYTGGKGLVVADTKEAHKLPYLDKVNIVAQTTQKEETFYQVAEIIKAKAGICQISNTICEPTKQRQKETIENAKSSDLVIVVGGRNSANTARLAKLCGELCPKVIHLESAQEINKEDILTPKKIFITAGASTPSWVIDEVAARVKNLRKKKISLPVILESFWDFIIKNSIFTAFAAVCLTYVCIKLQHVKPDPYLYLLTWLFIFTLTTVNKGGRGPIFKNNKLYLTVAVLGPLATLAVSLRYNIYVYAPIFLLLISGLIYTYRHKINFFISIPAAKDFVTALGWGFICVYVPASSQGLVFSKSAGLAFTYGILLAFMRSVILSVGTEHKDILLGKESFYKAFGGGVTKAVLIFIITAIAAVLINLMLMGWKSKLVFMLLIGHIYTVFTVIYFYLKKTPRSNLSETILDGQFYLLALLAYIGANLI